jgi:hypothetical protein
MSENLIGANHGRNAMKETTKFFGSVVAGSLMIGQKKITKHLYEF